MGLIANKPPFGAGVDKSSPLSQGLVSLWLFNELGGLKVFDIAGTNHGTMTNMANPSTSTSGRGFSKFGPCMVYDGSNDSVIVTHSSTLAITGDMTISAWVYIRDYGFYSGIVSKVKSAASAIPAPYDYWIESGTGRPALVLGDGTSSTLVYSTLAVPLNTWAMITATVRGTAMAHYLNGVANGTGTNSTTRADLADNVYIGNRHDGLPFRGSLSQVRLYSRALSSSEVSTLYRYPYAGIFQHPGYRASIMAEPANLGGFLVFM